jgi:hypothetical protein
MIELHFWPTSNGQKVALFLEEAGMPYEAYAVNIGKGDQFKPDFLKLSPNGKIPAILDRAPADGGAPVSVQTMTKTDTRNVEATLAQLHQLAEAGADIVRLACPDEKAAAAFGPNSMGMWPASSQLSAWGMISVSIKRRSWVRQASCSGRRWGLGRRALSKSSGMGRFPVKPGSGGRRL